MTINVTPIRHAVTKLFQTRENVMPDSATELLDPPADEVTDEITGAEASEVVAADLLVEEISIDGMCGVY
jgi:mycofactocin precursor